MTPVPRHEPEELRFFGKSPDAVLPGDVVIPSRGRYQGVQCEVKDVLRGKYSTYRIIVVPVLPVADEWGVDYTERVRTLSPVFAPPPEGEDG